MAGRYPAISPQQAKSERQKNSWDMWRIFRRPKTALQPTTFTTQSTTISPRKNHVLAPVFLKHPSKTPKTANPPVLTTRQFFLQKIRYKVKRTRLKVLSRGAKKTLKIKLPPTSIRIIIPNIPMRS
jgi:hypothetical protein